MLYLLHRLAAARGDGLRPELLEFLAARRAISDDPKVVDLAARRGDGIVQAGPNPRGAPGDAEVLNFKSRAARLHSTAGLRKAGND